MVKQRYTTNIFILKIKLHNYILYKEKKGQLSEGQLSDI